MTDNTTVTFDASTQRVVPLNPTDEMLNAGWDALGWSESGENDGRHPRDVFHAMIAAAPTPAAQSAGQEAVALTDEQILAIAVHHFKKGYDTAPASLAAFCDCVRSVVVGYAAPVNGGDPAWAMLTDVRQALGVPLDTPAHIVQQKTLEAARAAMSVDDGKVKAQAATVHRRIDALCEAANTPGADYFDASTNMLIATRDLLTVIGHPHAMDFAADQAKGDA